jgi:hypothetical protein
MKSTTNYDPDVGSRQRPLRQKNSRWLISGLILSLLTLPSEAELARVGPVSVEHGYPAWYQDKTGLTLEFGAPLNQEELDGGWTLILPADVPSGQAPETFPNDFADEHFYFAADAGFEVGGVKAKLILALEAAFSADVVAGGQIVFGRVRVRIDGLPANTSYRVYNPYNTLIVTSDDGGRIAYTDDIGISCAEGQFDCALFSNVGPFLLPSNSPGGAELPPTTGPVQGKLYIADPARSGPVTGSPIGQNYFKVERVSDGVLLGQTENFSLVGRIYDGPIPGKVNLDRSVYARSNLGNNLDLFATGFPTTQGRLPGQSQPAQTMPVLQYYEGPCLVNDRDEIIGAPIGLSPIQMFSAGNSYWGHSTPAQIPDYICVEDTTAATVGNQVIPVFFQAMVTDHVWITEARYDIAAKSLSIKAASSDKLDNPTLTLGGFEEDLVNGSILISPLAAPPSKVRVKSAGNGFAELAVWTKNSTEGNVPVAVNDSVVIDEDSGPHTINVLANDTIGGEPIGSGATIAIVTAPQRGTATVSSGAIVYTPSLNAFGSDSLAYTVQVDGLVSATAQVSITINPINDPPVALPDSYNTVVGTTVLNVLANDTDPDGFADLKEARFVGFLSWPDGATRSVQSGPQLTFSADTPGMYTFLYEAVDTAGAISAPAQVTVNVAPSEIITIARAEYRTRPQRLRVDGTDSLPAGQTLTIYYVANTGETITPAAGTTVVSSNGSWTLDVRAPRPSNANAVRVISSIQPNPAQATAPLVIR